VVLRQDKGSAVYQRGRRELLREIVATRTAPHFGAHKSRLKESRGSTPSRYPRK
jgi:hypothetical protein